MEAESSFIDVTQLIIAPETIPLFMSGSVMVRKVLPGGDPKLTPASSKAGSICLRMDAADLTEYGSRRIKYAIMMIVAVPAR